MAKIQDGKTFETAFLLGPDGRWSGETSIAIQRALDELFGQDDNEYFVHSEQIMEKILKRRKYKVLYVEDSTGHKQSVFFDITES